MGKTVFSFRLAKLANRFSAEYKLAISLKFLKHSIQKYFTLLFFCNLHRTIIIYFTWGLDLKSVLSMQGTILDKMRYQMIVTMPKLAQNKRPCRWYTIYTSTGRFTVNNFTYLLRARDVLLRQFLGFHVCPHYKETCLMPDQLE